VDKVLSTRVDPAIVDELNRMSKRLGLSKKQLIEEAIRLRAARARKRAPGDIWAETCGAWRRRESPRTTIRNARRAFQASATRHQRDARRS